MPHKKTQLSHETEKQELSLHNNVVRLLLAEQTKLVKVLVRLDLKTHKRKQSNRKQEPTTITTTLKRTI